MSNKNVFSIEMGRLKCIITVVYGFYDDKTTYNTYDWIYVCLIIGYGSNIIIIIIEKSIVINIMIRNDDDLLLYMLKLCQKYVIIVRNIIQ